MWLSASKRNLKTSLQSLWLVKFRWKTIYLKFENLKTDDLFKIPTSKASFHPFHVSFQTMYSRFSAKPERHFFKISFSEAIGSSTFFVCAKRIATVTRVEANTLQVIIWKNDISLVLLFTLT